MEFTLYEKWASAGNPATFMQTDPSPYIIHLKYPYKRVGVFKCNGIGTSSA